MKKFADKNNMSGFASLLMFGVFAVCILSVLLTGAGAYKRLTERDRDAFSCRTCSQYVMTKLRQASSPDAVSTGRFGEGDCLMLSEEIDGEEFVTRVYCFDGWLCELFTPLDGDFSPQDGEKVLEAESVSFELNGSVVEVVISDGSGDLSEFYLNIRGREVFL